MSLTVFAIALVIFTFGLGLLLRSGGKKQSSAARKRHDFGQPLFGDGTVNMTDEDEEPRRPEPIYAVWHDGPEGRERRRYGRVVRRKGTRLYIVPKDSPRTVVRRRLAVCAKVHYN